MKIESILLPTKKVLNRIVIIIEPVIQRKIKKKPVSHENL